ncbi:MAG: hypothetical protein ABW189_03330 [Rickettsiales bacterium]
MRLSFRFAAYVALIFSAACSRIPGVKMPPHLHGGKLPVVREWEDAYGEKYDEYRKGYEDGCESGFSAYSPQFYMTLNTWKQDWRLANGQGYGTYYKSWKDAYAYCSAMGLMFNQHTWGNHR